MRETTESLYQHFCYRTNVCLTRETCFGVREWCVEQFGIDAVAQQIPKLVRTVGTARKTASHADDRDRLAAFVLVAPDLCLEILDLQQRFGHQGAVIRCRCVLCHGDCALQEPSSAASMFASSSSERAVRSATGAVCAGFMATAVCSTSPSTSRSMWSPRACSVG